MRIAFVYDAVYPFVAGGVERRNYELARRLARCGHDVHVVGWQYWNGGDTYVADGVTLHGVAPAPKLHDARGLRTFREALAFAVRSAPVLAAVDADVIDCASIPYVPTFIVGLLGRARRTPVAITWHEYMGDRWHAYAGRRGRVASVVERQSARIGHTRIAVSLFTARRLPGGPRVEIIENGIDIDHIRSVTPATNRFDVVVAGRLVPHKRVNLVLDALSLSANTTALIIGDGPERGSLEARARDLGMTGRVHFAGRVACSDAVYAAFKAASAVIVPSEQEGFAMTAIEAQACATPPVVVRAEHSAAAELVRDGVNGFVVDATPNELASAIDDLVRSPETRERMGTSGTTAVRSYDWDLITARLEQVYATMLGIAPAPPSAMEEAA